MVVKDKNEPRDQKKAARAERHEARIKRQAGRTQKSASSDRPARLCSLATVEVKKGHDGYQLIVSGSDGRRSLNIAPHEVGQVLKDLETAIHVIRGQQ